MWIVTRAFLVTALLSPLACGHLLPQSAVVKYRTGGAVPSLQKVSRSGDYALYYSDDREPQIPIYLNAGEPIGFVKVPDGRVQAVAGDFRLNLSSRTTGAYWKRIPRR